MSWENRYVPQGNRSNFDGRYFGKHSANPILSSSGNSRLEKALETVDLHGSHTERGIAVSGNVNGKMISLFRAWSYYSPSGQTTRTAIAGGPLLDTLAVLPPEQYQQDTELKVKPAKQSLATTPATPATPTVATTPAPQITPTVEPNPVEAEPTDELAQVKKNAGIAA